ncbi:MAG: hypothetical protein ACI9FN_000623 [Saprospiraceae bacterium]|jgi:hypothetical protein
MKKLALALILILSLYSCKEERIIDTSPAGIIINECIEAHGGIAFETALYAFDFRNKSYLFDYDHGSYSYESIFRHEKGNVIRDILTNDGVTRKIDGKNVSLSDEKISSYSQSVNSVHYFAFLPFFLKDEAVRKELLGEESINGKSYDKIQVTFGEENGGNDHEDIYIYWVNKESKTMDYLAYSYTNPDDVGVRFRSAYNARVVEGIRFQDYINYKHDPETPVANLAALYQDGSLKELSRIELSNIRALKRIEE